MSMSQVKTRELSMCNQKTGTRWSTHQMPCLLHLKFKLDPLTHPQRSRHFVDPAFRLNAFPTQWCMQSVEALQWWNLSALLGSHPSLWKVLRRLTQSLKLDLFHPQKEEYQQWIMGTTSLWLGRWPPMFDMESRLTQMYTDATFGHCHHAIRDILTPVLLALYESRRKSKSK